MDTFRLILQILELLFTAIINLNGLLLGVAFPSIHIGLGLSLIIPSGHLLDDKDNVVSAFSSSLQLSKYLQCRKISWNGVKISVSTIVGIHVDMEIDGLSIHLSTYNNASATTSSMESSSSISSPERKSSFLVQFISRLLSGMNMRLKNVKILLCNSYDNHITHIDNDNNNNNNSYGTDVYFEETEYITMYMDDIHMKGQHNHTLKTIKVDITSSEISINLDDKKYTRRMFSLFGLSQEVRFNYKENHLDANVSLGHLGVCLVPMEILILCSTLHKAFGAGQVNSTKQSTPPSSTFSIPTGNNTSLPLTPTSSTIITFNTTINVNKCLVVVYANSNDVESNIEESGLRQQRPLHVVVDVIHVESFVMKMNKEYNNRDNKCLTSTMSMSVHKIGTLNRVDECSITPVGIEKHFERLELDGGQNDQEDVISFVYIHKMTGPCNAVKSLVFNMTTVSINLSVECLSSISYVAAELGSVIKAIKAAATTSSASRKVACIGKEHSSTTLITESTAWASCDMCVTSISMSVILPLSLETVIFPPPPPSSSSQNVFSRSANESGAIELSLKDFTVSSIGGDGSYINVHVASIALFHDENEIERQIVIIDGLNCKLQTGSSQSLSEAAVSSLPKEYSYVAWNKWASGHCQRKNELNIENVLVEIEEKVSIDNLCI